MVDGGTVKFMLVADGSRLENQFARMQTRVQKLEAQVRQLSKSIKNQGRAQQDTMTRGMIYVQNMIKAYAGSRGLSWAIQQAGQQLQRFAQLQREIVEGRMVVGEIKRSFLGSVGEGISREGKKAAFSAVESSAAEALYGRTEAYRTFVSGFQASHAGRDTEKVRDALAYLQQARQFPSADEMKTAGPLVHAIARAITPDQPNRKELEAAYLQGSYLAQLARKESPGETFEAMKDFRPVLLASHQLDVGDIEPGISRAEQAKRRLATSQYSAAQFTSLQTALGDEGGGLAKTAAVSIASSLAEVFPAAVGIDSSGKPTGQMLYRDKSGTQLFLNEEQRAAALIGEIPAYTAAGKQYPVALAQARFREEMLGRAASKPAQRGAVDAVLKVFEEQGPEALFTKRRDVLAGMRAAGATPEMVQKAVDRKAEEMWGDALGDKDLATGAAVQKGVSDIEEWKKGLGDIGLVQELLFGEGEGRGYLRRIRANKALPFAAGFGSQAQFAAGIGAGIDPYQSGLNVIEEFGEGTATLGLIPRLPALQGVDDNDRKLLETAKQQLLELRRQSRQRESGAAQQQSGQHRE